MTIKQCHDITAIDFQAWQQEAGISCLLLDVEGTLTSWGDDSVDQTTVKSIANAAQAGYQIGLVTNIKPSDIQRLQRVALQIGVDLYLQPHKASERKPSPIMLQRAMAQLGVGPGQVGFVGDKFVDVLAAKRAGINHIVWLDRLGRADHPLDRLLYRPIEPLLKWFVRRYFA